MVLKGLLLISLLFGTLGGCGGIERTDFSFIISTLIVVVLKSLVFNHFHFFRMRHLEMTDFG